MMISNAIDSDFISTMPLETVLDNLHQTRVVVCVASERKVTAIWAKGSSLSVSHCESQFGGDVRLLSE